MTIQALFNRAPSPPRRDRRHDDPQLSEIHDTLLRMERLLDLMVPAEVKAAIAKAQWEKDISTIGLRPSDFEEPGSGT
jgi:hypothetical protein